MHSRYSVNVPRIIKLSTDLLLNICFVISTLSDPWDAKLNKTHSFYPKSSPSSWGKGSEIQNMLIKHYSSAREVQLKS